MPCQVVSPGRHGPERLGIEGEKGPQLRLAVEMVSTCRPAAGNLCLDVSDDPVGMDGDEALSSVEVQVPAICGDVRARAPEREHRTAGSRRMGWPVPIRTDHRARAHRRSTRPCRSDQLGCVSMSGASLFARGCQTCHDPVGDALSNLTLARGGGGGEAVRPIRQGRPGMPAYSQVNYRPRVG
jgi:hypothetical protein